MAKSKTKAKAKKVKELKGEIIHHGSLYDVMCNGKNHYVVSLWGSEVQCGCFCKKAKYKKNGFTPDLLKTPVVKDGVKLEKSATMEWLERIGVL